MNNFKWFAFEDGNMNDRMYPGNSADCVRDFGMKTVELFTSLREFVGRRATIYRERPNGHPESYVGGFPDDRFSHKGTNEIGNLRFPMTFPFRARASSAGSHCMAGIEPAVSPLALPGIKNAKGRCRSSITFTPWCSGWLLM